MKFLIRQFTAISRLSAYRSFCTVMAETVEKNASAPEIGSDSIESKKRALSGEESDGDGTEREENYKKAKTDDHPESIEPKSKKRRRPEKPKERTGPILNNPEYYFENGLRKVRPYWFQFVSSAKGRWIGRRIGEVFEHELYTKDPSFFTEQAKLGRVSVNGKPASLDHIFKHNDVVKNVTHRHEMPVLDRPIEIVHVDDDVVVVNKPCSIPSHPCGRYFFNSLSYFMENDHGITGLRITHRLDRLTSGLIIFAKTLAKAQELYTVLSGRTVSKEYVCRVAGTFPDGEVICDQPLGSLSTKMGIHCVTQEGKSATTRFVKLFSDGNESVVRCIPVTGRTHQIRVHLQYLGYPIVNDNMYNNTIFGPEKGKGGVFGKPREELIKDINVAFGGAAWVDDFENELSAYVEKRPESSMDAPTAKPDFNSPFYDAHCPDCHMKSRDPSLEQMEMYLHCLKYEGPDWSYSTPMPIWAIPPEKSSSS